MTEQEIRRAELAPQRYGGLMLTALFVVGAISVAREEGSVLAAAQELAFAAIALAWSWRGWRRSLASPDPAAGR